jgi:hypothetical protein
MMTHRILKAKRFWIAVVSIPLLLWAWYWSYQNKTIGFSVPKITSDFAYNPEWSIVEPDLDQVERILHQKFKFLAVGSQSYAFASEDGKYVLKFFRMKHLIPRITDFFNPDQVEYRKDTLLSVFDAYKLAYEELREDAGLIYIHLNKTDHLKTDVQVVDWLGRTHTIDLDQTEFVIQERAELIFTNLKKLLIKGDRQTVEKRVGSILELVQRQIDKGITDHDKAVKHNYGFIGDRAVHLDIGRIYKEKKPRDYNRIEERINKWVTENSSS